MHITPAHALVVWDNSLTPGAEISPGTAVTSDPENTPGGRITRDSAAAAIGRPDSGRVHPVTGPPQPVSLGIPSRLVSVHPEFALPDAARGAVA